MKKIIDTILIML